MAKGHDATQQRYRLLHSSGELLADERATALLRLGQLPGAKLFVVATRPARPAERQPQAKRRSDAREAMSRPGR